VVLEKVMADEMVDPGDRVLTSGGDQIFPKGLPVGMVTKASPGPELFLIIRVHPAANLGKLEEVLVITKKEERSPPASAAETRPMRASDILAQRLPSVPEKPAGEANNPGNGKTTGQIQAGTAKSSGRDQFMNSGAQSATSTPNPGTPAPLKPRTAVPNSVKPASAQNPGVSPAVKVSDQLSKSAPLPAKPAPPPSKPSDTDSAEEKPQ
jgi:rod shape-determining protein MreC